MGLSPSEGLRWNADCCTVRVGLNIRCSFVQRTRATREEQTISAHGMLSSDLRPWWLVGPSLLLTKYVDNERTSGGEFDDDCVCCGSQNLQNRRVPVGEQNRSTAREDIFGRMVRWLRLTVLLQSESVVVLRTCPRSNNKIPF